MGMAPATTDPAGGIHYYEVAPDSTTTEDESLNAHHKLSVLTSSSGALGNCYCYSGSMKIAEPKNLHGVLMP